MSDTIIDVVRRGDRIEYHNQAKIEIPNLDLLTLLFDSEHGTAQETTILHAEAADPSLHITKADARRLTQQIAHTLRHKYGVGASKKKSYVTVLSSGNYLLPTVFYGVVAAGGIFSSVSSAATTPELARLINSAPSDLVICSRELRDLTIAAAKASNLDSSRILVLDPEHGTMRDLHNRPVVGQEQLPWERITSRKELEERVICLIYSSGTTGLPKGVPLTHMNIVSQTYITGTMQRPRLAKLFPGFKYVTLAHLPVAHIAGLLGFIVNPVLMGGTTYWMPKFDFAQFLEYNKRYGVSIFFTVPPIYLLIAKSPAVTDQLKSMRIGFTGAAPMKKELQEAAAKKIGDGSICLIQTWGLSESTGSATILNVDERDDTGSVSRLMPTMSARIVNEQGKDVGPGEEGEIYIKGPVVFRGYHNNPEADAGAFDKDRWFMTGDVGTFVNGLLYIVDRKKELIKYKGLQVAPAELEGLLMSHPDILDAAVIGIEAEGTEVPRAYVVVADKQQMTEEKIKAFVKENMASHKQLRGGVIYLEAIPKSPSGKILRKDLRIMAKKEAEAPKSKL